MGGGEIARYLGTYGSARVARAVIVSGVPPYLLKTPETPHGVPQEVFDEIAAALTADRAAYFTEWNKSFFNLDETLGKLISAEAVQDAWNLAVSASPEGTIACVPTWHTDFRADLPKIDIPVLVMHGTGDRILPIEACGARTHELIHGSEYVPVERRPRPVLDARQRGQRRAAPVLQVARPGRRHEQASPPPKREQDGEEQNRPAGMSGASVKRAVLAPG